MRPKPRVCLQFGAARRELQELRTGEGERRDDPTAVADRERESAAAVAGSSSAPVDSTSSAPRRGPLVALVLGGVGGAG